MVADRPDGWVIDLPCERQRLKGQENEDYHHGILGLGVGPCDAGYRRCISCGSWLAVVSFGWLGRGLIAES